MNPPANLLAAPGLDCLSWPTANHGGATDMNDSERQRLLALLEEIRDNQKAQIERQAEALDMQRRQFAILEKQQERADRIQDRAEQIQNKSAQLVAGARKVMAVVIPIIIALIAYLTWLMFRR